MVSVCQVALIATLLAVSTASASVRSKPWGTSSQGQPVALYTLTGEAITVTITTYGARVVSIDVPDRSGKTEDVVLGWRARSFLYQLL